MLLALKTEEEVDSRSWKGMDMASPLEPAEGTAAL